VAGAPVTPPPWAVRVVAVVGRTTNSVNDSRYHDYCRCRTPRDATRATGCSSDAGDDLVQLVAVSPAIRPTVRLSRAGGRSAKLSPRPSVIVGVAVVVSSSRRLVVNGLSPRAHRPHTRWRRPHRSSSPCYSCWRPWK